jgi:hypothetical protein
MRKLPKKKKLWGHPRQTKYLHRRKNQHRETTGKQGFWFWESYLEKKLWGHPLETKFLDLTWRKYREKIPREKTTSKEKITWRNYW